MSVGGARSAGPRDTAPAASQLELPLRRRGGARRGAGRKPAGARAGASHAERPELSRHHPVHVTVRLKEDAPSLRVKQLGRIVFRVFAEARERHGARLTHFSIQATHLHLIVEARDKEALSRAMQGLGVRLARRLNRATGRAGSLYAERYHARVLKTPLEVRRALLYVINNYRRHLAQAGAQPPPDWADPFSSIDFFDGVRPLGSGRVPCAEYALGRAPPVVPAASWLLAEGWKRHGLIGIAECPGAARRAR